MFQTPTNIKAFLDEHAEKYESVQFIKNDPIAIPHLFSKKQDIEISGFLTALLSWGQRTSILNKSRELMERMEMQPYDFVINARKSDLLNMKGFVYRTMNEEDIINIILILKHIYEEKGGLEQIMSKNINLNMSHIQNLRECFEVDLQKSRTMKHIASPQNGSAAKRINMFLRWMVRPSDKGVDFGIWNKLQSADLLIPLDVHSGRIARKLGLLSRKADDSKSVRELTLALQEFDPIDPIKYDFALFGLGVNKAF